MNRTLTITIVLLLVVVMIIVIVMLVIHPYPKFDIDAVYTWVQHDRFLQEDMLSYGAEEEHNHLIANYVDNKELLYSLRSLEKNAPWIRRIYLVVRDGQRPSWMIDPLPDKFHIIHHSQIIPARALPTFNSLCIESFLHKIPGLAEHYLYFNDDMILLQPVYPRDFFDRSHRTIETDCYHVKDTPRMKMDAERRLVSNVKDKPYKFLEMMKVNSAILSAVFPKRSRVKKRYQSQHIPNANRITYQEELDTFLESVSWKKDKKTLQEHTILSRTRKNRDVARNSIFKKYWNMYMYGSSCRVHDLIYIELNHLKSKKEEIEALASISTSYRFLCVQNNIAYADKNAVIGARDFEVLHRVLDAKFPTPSFVEKKNLGKS